MAKWCRVKHQGREYTGLVQGDNIELHTDDILNSPQSLGRDVPLSDVEWLPPVFPVQFLALWNNFHERREKEKLFVPKAPLYFTKLQTCTAAHQQPITVPPGFSGRVKFEAELGAVIGKRCFQVPVDNVDEYVFGYTCVNDVTAPEILFEENGGFDNWCRSKSFPTFGPIGPVIETDVEPDDLWVDAILNGERKQHYPADDMIYKPREVISMISREVELLPGDVIAYGTSVGAADMQPGDEIVVEIPGVGSLINHYSNDTVSTEQSVQEATEA